MVPTRREVLKVGGVAALAGLARPVVAGAATATAMPHVEPGPTPVAPELARSARPRFRRGGPGPLYWSTYGYENAANTMIPEQVWKRNIDWLADNFRDFGYTMACTDGWIDNTQRTTPHGYITSQADDWEHDWAWWAQYLKAKGLELGVYYNPLWATLSAVNDPAVTVVGRPNIKVADIVNPGDNFGGLLRWIDTTRDGAEEYVKGYVAYFRDLGAAWLRIDFLGWYEIGYDQSEGTISVAHGREAYFARAGVDIGRGGRHAIESRHAEPVRAWFRRAPLR